MAGEVEFDHSSGGRSAIVLPREPMAPINDDSIPVEDGWGFQLKWDGVRLLASVDDGDVRLFSRKMLPKNAVFPEIVYALAQLKGRYLFDGEAIVFDPVKQRPDFQQVLIRERSGARTGRSVASAGGTRASARVDSAERPSESTAQSQPLPSRRLSSRPVSYVLFDLLHDGDRDLRKLPYDKRYARLKEVAPEKTDAVFVTDLFTDGKALWQWVEERGWEGIISKRMSSPYREGKKHRDWLKKKTALILDIQIVGITYREGRLASLIMMKDGRYFGKVSLGLTARSSRALHEYMLATNRRHATEPVTLTNSAIREQGRLNEATSASGAPGQSNEQPSPTRISGHSTVAAANPLLPFSPLPEDLRGNLVIWLDVPFTCTVTGLEITSAGVLRHPKLVNFAVPTVITS